MTTATPGSRRTVVEAVLGAVLLTACGTVVALGVATWAATLLQAAHPCGETYPDHPSCRLRRPDAVALGNLLMTGVPALCAAGAVLGCTLTFVLRRRAAVLAALSFAVALAAFLAGRTMLLSALTDVGPFGT